ncbi:MAG: RHS repeat-associated core domain-containing protein [Gammaproteobacteria bacterium]
MSILTRLLLGVLLTLLVPSGQAVERVIHYHNDALGSPIFATNQRGEVVWRRSYAPYGQELNRDAPNEPGYTGKFEEPDLGISDFGARWYDPRIGRFLAIDPVGFSTNNPQGFNRYAYANNNPYRFVDPDGRIPLDTIWDFGNVVYDVATGNWADAAIDAGAMFIPYVPAGISKLRHADDVAEAVGDAVQVAKRVAAEGKTVLGHHPEYKQLAESLSARRFNIPEAAWNKMSEAERWGANQKFLDRMVSRGDEIILATALDKVRPGSYFARELEYLGSKGFVPSADGTRLIKP